MDVLTEAASPICETSSVGKTPPGINRALLRSRSREQGRTPSLAFGTRQYLDANPDVKAAQIDPLFHFLAVGAAEGRLPIPPTELVTASGFDFVYYFASNPDVAAAGVDPFWHFQTTGWLEGRDPNAWFDTSGYLSTYTDVAAAHINPLVHYGVSGWKEGRDPSLAFDTAAYLAANPDVAAAQVNPLVHFLQTGHHEGRPAIPDGIWGAASDARPASTRVQNPVREAAKQKPAASAAGFTECHRSDFPSKSDSRETQALFARAATSGRSWRPRRWEVAELVLKTSSLTCSARFSVRTLTSLGFRLVAPCPPAIPADPDRRRAGEERVGLNRAQDIRIDLHIGRQHRLDVADAEQSPGRR